MTTHKWNEAKVSYIWNISFLNKVIYTVCEPFLKTLHHSNGKIFYSWLNSIFFLLWLCCLLPLPSRFSRVRLCETPWTAAYQTPPSLGFSRQEHWVGLPFPSPMHESEKWKGSCSVVSDSSQPHGLKPTRLLCPWDLPGKSTGVGCHRLLLIPF